MADIIKILILEDVLLDAELSKRELKNEGINFHSIIVEDREDYIRELKNFKPDLILADHSLPQFDGLSALKIKKDVSPDTPFIFVSGKIGEEFAVEMLKEGATDYVLKNNLIKLGPAVKRALKEAQEHRAHRIAQAALLENEERYRALFEESINPIIVLDENGYCIDFNRSSLEFFDNINLKTLKKHINELLTFDVDQETNNTFWKTGGSFEAFYHYNNTTKYLDISFNPVKIKNTLTIFGIAKDLTSQKKAEILLKEKEEEYRLLIENQTDYIIKFDLDGKLRFVSPSYCEILGKNETELLNESFIPLIHEDDRVKTDKAIDLLFKPPYTSYLEHRAQTKNGWRWIAWSYKAIIDKNNKVSGFVGVGRDIHDQIRAQKALKESEIKYRSIFENTGAMTMLFDQDMKIILVNSEFEKFSGYPKKAVEGKRNVSDFVYAEDISRIEGYHRMQRINPDAIPKNYEVQLVNKDGNVKDFFATFDMIPDTDKGIISFMDITDRKIAENKIKNSLREKELLLREIHHRVKNNLQIISTLLELQCEQIKDERIVELYRESENRIQSIALIHENLYQSKDLATIHMDEYINNLLTDLMNSYGKETDVNLVVDVDEITMSIETSIPCGLIINELISNSLKYAFPEGVSGNVFLSLKEVDTGIFILIIRDDGLAFPDDLDDRKNRTLGLNMVNNLVKQLDGKIKFDKVKKEFKIKFRELSYKKRI
ncbi:MAG: PAS domain S-box protein [Methanobacteriaceae archaeon]|nr:PAS domain S-box protein [Methanobacteriaceae archaeon]